MMSGEFIFLHMTIQWFWYHLLKNSLLYPLNCPNFFCQDQLGLFVWINFWVLYSLPLVYVYICSFTNITQPPFSWVQFSHSVVSDSFRPHEPQHARPPCPSPTPGVHSNSCPSSRWCHPAISSSVVPFSSCPHSLPASKSFPMSHLFAWGGQSIGVSASTSVLSMNIQDWSPLGWTGWIFLQSSPESSPTSQFKSINSSVLSFLHSPTLTSIHENWKNHSLD